MRVAAFTGYGGIEDIEILERSDPDPGECEAVVRVEAASLNHRDLWPLKREGDGEGDLPFVPGGDLAGAVEEVGGGVSRVGEGDRVVLCPLLACGECRFCRDGPENMCENYESYDGAFAERALVPADRLVALPDAVGFDDAAALPIAYMTAYRMLKLGGAAAGDRVFVPGATGGVGLAAVQLSGVIGAETVGTSTSRGKLDRVEEEGLDHAIHSGDPDEIRDAVAAVGDADVTIDHLGGPYTAVGAEALRRGGTMVMCGRTAGGYPEFDAGEFYFAHKRIVGNMLGTQRDLEELVAFVADGRLAPAITERYPLADTAEAFRDMDERDLVGKLVIRPGA